MSPNKKFVFVVLVLILIVTVAGFALSSPDYTQFLEIFHVYFLEQCRSLQTTTKIEIQGLNSSDLGELNQIINLSILLSYDPPPYEYNQNNPDTCEFLHENTTIKIQREKETLESFSLQINDSYTFERTLKLTSDGIWIIEAERTLVFTHAGNPYTRTSPNPDNKRAFKVLVTEELTLLPRSTRPASFWENPVLIAILSAALSAITALVVRIIWRRWKRKTGEGEVQGT